MSPSDKAEIQKLLAQLFAQPEQQVPEGNPIADYFGQQATDARRISGPAAMLSAVTAPAALYSAPNPAMSLPLGALAAGGLLVNGYFEDTAKKADRGEKMWRNETSSGPAYRRGK
jgi:hypothetical protein